MKFLADMGISQTTVNWLRKQRYDAVHVRAVNMHKASDKEIVKKAREEGRIILTQLPRNFHKSRLFKKISDA